MRYRIAIVGAGLIGTKRAEALKQFKNCRLVVVADVDEIRARKLAATYSAEATADWKAAVRRDDVDVVIVAVVNNVVAQIAIAALKEGKHVLCEKPFGISRAESEKIAATANKHAVEVRVGFNHRFHPALMKAKKLFDAGTIGKLLFIRGRYGHGGRVGMEKEWRMNAAIAGGGELLDQGVHLIDLCRWFAGDFTELSATCDTKFWKSDVEDNAFVVMKNKNVTASFHVSTTNWGNIFSFEIFGDKGSLVISGLGRRYGTETLTIGKRQVPFNDLSIKTIVFPSTLDTSWQEEWKNFLQAVEKKPTHIGSAADGIMANKIVEAAYRSSRTKKTLFL